MLILVVLRLVRFAALLCCAAVLLSGRAHAELVRVNGVAVEVRRLTVAGEPQVAAVRLSRRWRAAGVGSHVTLTPVGDGVVVGRQRGALHEAVLFRGGASFARSEATISVTHLSLGVRPVPSLPVAMPLPVRTVSVVESGAGDTASIEFVVLVDAALRPTTTGLTSALRHDGWSLQSVEPWRATRGSESLLIVARGSSRGTSLVVQKRGGIRR